MALFDLPPARRALEVPGQAVSPVLSRAEMELAEAFPAIRPGCDYPFATGGKWALPDLIWHLLGFTGPAALWATTWNIGRPTVDKLIDWRREGFLTQCRLLVDWSVQTNHPGLVGVCRAYTDKVAIEAIHAKTFVMLAPGWSLSYMGSANLSRNPAIECGYISTNPAVAEFNRNWIDLAIEGGKPFGVTYMSGRHDEAIGQFEEMEEAADE